jgi:rod shape-determining protein MreD
MLQRIFTVIAILVAATLQIILGQWMSGWTPDLMLIVILAIGMFGESVSTIWWVVLGGLLLDVTIGSPTGFYLISFGCIGLIVTALNRQVFQQPTPIVAVALFFIIALVYESILGLITDSFMLQILVRAATTALLASIAYIGLLTFGKRQEVIQLG